MNTQTKSVPSISIGDLQVDRQEMRDLTQKELSAVKGGDSSSSSSSFSYDDKDYSYSFQNDNGKITESGSLPGGFSRFSFFG